MTLISFKWLYGAALFTLDGVVYVHKKMYRIQIFCLSYKHIWRATAGLYYDQNSLKLARNRQTLNILSSLQLPRLNISYCFPLISDICA